MLAILTVDLDRGMYSLDRDGVMAGAQVVYGSDNSLYVASRRYVRALETRHQDVPDGIRTEIHRFDISNPERTVYRATGTVPGFILNNYALSEFDGQLRVATTEEPPGSRTAPATQSQSTVTVLQQDGDGWSASGPSPGSARASGSTPCGSWARRATSSRSARSTRCTRSTCRPAAPKVVGELKIPGYSAYLHPVGENRLLGIGREGADVQASLFDVSNMAAPQRSRSSTSAPARPRSSPSRTPSCTGRPRTSP